MNPIPSVRRLKTPDDRDGIRSRLFGAAKAAEPGANELILFGIEGQGARDVALERYLQNWKNLPPSSIARGLPRCFANGLDLTREQGIHVGGHVSRQPHLALLGQMHRARHAFGFLDAKMGLNRRLGRAQLLLVQPRLDSRQPEPAIVARLR
jgi:hypothetical protein